ncbi:MAG: HupE/UreJ family protein, partial [Myxococcales bacterium]|nr:HupE/UreJ family protein [Myxococcales bacterium]
MTGVSPTLRRLAVTLALLAALAAAPTPAAAHQGGKLYITVRTTKTRDVYVTLTGRPVDFAPAIGGLRGASPRLYTLRADDVTRYAARYLVLDSERGKLCKLAKRALHEAVIGKVVVKLRYLCPRGKLRLRSDLFFDDDPDLRVFVTLELGRRTPPKLLLLSRKDRSVSFEPPTSSLHVALEFLLLGVEHIYGGYDHVLFLVALLLAAPLYSRRDARAGPGFRGAFVYMLKIVTT